MNEIWDYLANNWTDWAIPLAFLAAALIAGCLVRWLLKKTWLRWASQTQNQANNLLILTMSRSVVFWSLLLGLYLAVNAAPLSAHVVGMANQGLLILWVISLTLAGSQLASSLVLLFGSKIPGALPVTSLTQTVARWLVIIIGLLILLSQFGISITPILTALGVGGLAVALALKDTLSNLFAGFYVSLARLIRPGDYIKLDSSEEGYVADIGWRCTTIRTDANNLIILPNEKLAQAIVTNYDLPEKSMGMSIPVSVSYDCDPDEVERMLLAVAQEGARDIPGLLADPEPAARLIPGFGDTALNFTLSCRVAQFADQGPVQHELRKRILKRFRETGITMPGSR